MGLSKKYSIMISVGLILTLLGGCGSGSTDDKKAEDNGAVVNDDTNGTPNGDNSDINPIGSASDGLVAGNGVLVETKGGVVLTWVNSTGDEFCKISRSTSRAGTVYQDGVAHCQALASQTYASISSWRLPTESEAKNLMKLENKNLLLFPTSNPNCAIMTTSSENTFVYTTSDWNIRDNNPVGGEFIDASRNDKTAGIRCVATTQ